MKDVNSGFPVEIYVGKIMSSRTRDKVDKVELDAHCDWEACENDDVIAVYQLVKVCKVKVETKKSLVEV